MEPKKLHRLFNIISSLGLVTILGFSYLGMSSALKEYNIETAQQISKNVGFVLYQLEKNSLIDPKTNQLTIAITNKDLIEFDTRIRQLLKPLNIVKIKIFSLDTRIIYSTEHKLIGKINDDNTSLHNAVKGIVSSDMRTRDEFVDLANESRFDVDVVETYLPMFDTSNQVKGVYEVYMDITSYRISSEKALNSQIYKLTVILFIIFILLNVLIWLSTKKMTCLQNSLKHQATHDVLTGIYNRSYLIERLKEELAHVIRSDTKKDKYYSTVILIDIDFFKVFNDKYGHLLGDDVLKAFAQRLKHEMRQEDVVGRYGGEEFIAILPMTKAGDAMVLLKRVHESLVSKPFEINNEFYDVGCSIGVSNVFGADNSINSVISRADKALYYVKSNGRNNIADYSEIT